MVKNKTLFLGKLYYLVKTTLPSSNFTCLVINRVEFDSILLNAFPEDNYYKMI